MSNPYTSLSILDLIVEMRRAANECPESLSMSGWGKDPEVTQAHERYSDFLRTTSAENITRLLDYVEGIDKDRKEAGRIFNARDVETLIQHAFRLKPEGYERPEADPTDINSAIDFVRMAVDNPKVIRIPPPPNSHSAHYTALMCSLIALCGSQGMDAEDALKHATYVLRKEFIE